jgi:hypothetical protein
MKLFRAISLALLMPGILVAQTQPATGNSETNPPTKTADQIKALEAAVAQQQQQIEELRRELAAQKAAPSGTPELINASLSTKGPDGSAARVNDVSLSTREPQKPAQDLGKALGINSDKIKLGVTAFGDFQFYTDTGFGPQFITQINQPGPGNEHFNSFDITRTYLNFFYTPNEAVTLRVTPNIFREVDGTSGAIANGTGAQIGGSTNGNLSFRLKYAYIEFNKLFKDSPAFGKTKITFGSETQPLTDWEEGLYGYRFTSLTPWNYLSLSSTFVGAKMHGPIEFNGKDYLDWDLGVFNTASFHAIEQNDKKQAMARLTWYPVGTKTDRTGFGITGFYNYGYNTKTPDTKSTPLYRVALLTHYQTHSKSAQIAFEYDLGRNAFSTGNLFSGTAPVPGGPFFAGGAATDIGTVAAAVLSGDRTKQQGYAAFGHVNLGSSPFALFGLFQYFQPNTNFPGTNPIDFDRTVGGLSYHYNSHLDLALQDSNFHWVHPQGTVGATDTNAIFLNFQFNY